MTATPSAALQVSGLDRVFDISAPLLNRVFYRQGKRYLHAVNDVSFEVPKGGCLSLVGESGCGKSTVAKLVTGLYPASAGEIRFAPGKSGLPLSTQMIFQDPYASLNPRWRVRNIIAEPLREWKLRETEAEIQDRVAELLGVVGLNASDGEKFPHEFSGGQRQRISIARALASEPEFLVCDEPTSALDVSVQAQILNLMRRLQDELGLTYLFISHDLGVVRHISDRVAIMYLGKIVEISTTAEIFARANHPYTQALIAEVPNLERRKRVFVPIQGEIPSPLKPPSGCTFHPRCPHAMPRCREQAPTLQAIAPGHWSACHLNQAAS